MSKLGLDLDGHLRCKWPKMGHDFTHVNLFSINYGGLNSGNLQGKVPEKFGANSCPNRDRI